MILNVCSPQWDKADSYGIQAHYTARAFEQRGDYVNRIGHISPLPDVFITPSMGGILMGYPTNFLHYGALANMGKRITLTHWESTILLPKWVDLINKTNGLVVATQFVADVMKHNGVIVQVEIIPLGVDETYKTPKRRERKAVMEFLTIADRGLRKGADIAVEAFRRAFQGDPRYHLTVKCRGNDWRELFPQVSLVAEDMSVDDMNTLYHRSDVMLFPSRGEGFGFPPREFVATGGISLATNWSGTKDDIQQWGVPIEEYSLVTAWQCHPDWYGKQGVWAEPNAESLSYQLGHVVDHFEQYTDHAMQGAEFVANTYTWDCYGEKLREFWERV